MNVYLALQVTDSFHEHLLSLALVSESGLELYLEIDNYPREYLSSFANEAIVPLLGKAVTGTVVSKDEVCLKISEFLNKFTDIKILCYHNYEWWSLLELLKEIGVPELEGENISSSIDQMALQSYFFKNARHHAIHRARGLKSSYRRNSA